MRKRSASGSGKIWQSGKVLELGVPPKDIQMEEVGEWVTWGPVIEPAPEGPPLAPLRGGAVGRECCASWCKRMVLWRMMMPQSKLLCCQPKQAQLDHCCCGVGVLFGGHVVGVDFAPWRRTD